MKEYNPELIKQLLGEQVAELFDGTIEVTPSNNTKIHGLIVGDILTFKFKDNETECRQFVITVD